MSVKTLVRTTPPPKAGSRRVYLLCAFLSHLFFTAIFSSSTFLPTLSPKPYLSEDKSIPKPSHPASHPLSTLYACTTSTCDGVSNEDLVNAVYSFIATQTAPNHTTWGGDKCQWNWPSPPHFQLSWPSWLRLPRSSGSTIHHNFSDQSPLCLPLGITHTFTLHAYSAQGGRVCVGGDYLEARLDGASVKYRPTTVDNGDGTYSVSILLPDDPLLVSTALLSVAHLFTGLAGLAWSHQYQTASSTTAMALPPLAVRLVRWGEGCGASTPFSPPTPTSLLPAPSVSCRTLDFMAIPFWHGHWVAQPMGDKECRAGACTGMPSGLLSLSWVYRLPHCYFHLFTPPEAQACLNHSWVFFSGDSTALDSLGNLLTTVLELEPRGWIDMGIIQPIHKNFDATGEHWSWNASTGVAQYPPLDYWRVNSPQQQVGGALGAPLEERGAKFFARFTNLWNAAAATSGAPHEAGYQGLTVIHNEGWQRRHRDTILPWTPGGLGPDVFVVNSGMHDGFRFSLSHDSFRDYNLYLSHSAPQWWRTLRDMATPPPPSACRPRMVWRHNMAPSGWARTKRSNPQHMEIFNRMSAEVILKHFNYYKGEGGNATSDGGGGEEGSLEQPLPNKPPPAKPRGKNGCVRPQQGEREDWGFLDAFDLTFPWHFDDNVSDGGHYGRHWRLGADSVDINILTVLLNDLCPFGG